MAKHKKNGIHRLPKEKIAETPGLPVPTKLPPSAMDKFFSGLIGYEGAFRGLKYLSPFDESGLTINRWSTKGNGQTDWKGNAALATLLTLPVTGSYLYNRAFGKKPKEKKAGLASDVGGVLWNYGAVPAINLWQVATAPKQMVIGGALGAANWAARKIYDKAYPAIRTTTQDFIDSANLNFDNMSTKDALTGAGLLAAVPAGVYAIANSGNNKETTEDKPMNKRAGIGQDILNAIFKWGPGAKTGVTALDKALDAEKTTHYTNTYLPSGIIYKMLRNEAGNVRPGVQLGAQIGAGAGVAGGAGYAIKRHLDAAAAKLQAEAANQSNLPYIAAAIGAPLAAYGIYKNYLEDPVGKPIDREKGAAANMSIYDNPFIREELEKTAGPIDAVLGVGGKAKGVADAVVKRLYKFLSSEKPLSGVAKAEGMVPGRVFNARKAALTAGTSAGATYGATKGLKNLADSNTAAGAPGATPGMLDQLASFAQTPEGMATLAALGIGGYGAYKYMSPDEKNKEASANMSIYDNPFIREELEKTAGPLDYILGKGRQVKGLADKAVNKLMPFFKGEKVVPNGLTGQGGVRLFDRVLPKKTLATYGGAGATGYGLSSVLQALGLADDRGATPPPPIAQDPGMLANALAFLQTPAGMATAAALGAGGYGAYKYMNQDEEKNASVKDTEAFYNGVLNKLAGGRY